MVRRYFVLLFMLFSLLNSVPEKRYINTNQDITPHDFFTHNTHLPSGVKEEPLSKGSKKSRKTISQHSSELAVALTDIPVCVDGYNKEFKILSSETRYEFMSHQSVESLQQLYLTELTRLGWNVEVISVLKEVVLLGIKPRKKVVILLDKIEGGWFSRATSHIIIVIKEQ